MQRDRAVVDSVAGVQIRPLAGAGNHTVFGLTFDGRQYCLKIPTPSGRHQGDPDLVLRREVGGMCTLADAVGDSICPRPLWWNASPAWLVSELIPGTHLGNVELSDEQLLGLAAAYKTLYAVTPQTLGHRFWPIDWSPELVVSGLEKQLPNLVEAGTEKPAAAEAASLVGRWLQSGDSAAFLAPGDCIAFARGDQNMANALWDGSRIRFVDFEYCGWNDIALDLSLVTDHVQSVATPPTRWDFFIEQFDLSPAQHHRLLAGRRRQTLSWLTKACLGRRMRGLPEGDPVQILLDRARELLDR